ncbi:MAG: GGDEF domain-containing protein [Acidobacteriota bacterium]|nr:GGDEF domain-containing protein [Acidobacteriota bacterium]
MSINVELRIADANAELPLDLLKLLQNCRTLPNVPAVAVQVLDLANNIDDVGTADIAHIVERDPAMVARIMKVANSIHYGIKHEVSTLEQAVALLGLAETINLSLAFYLVRELKSKPGLNFDYRQYWRRSVMSAAASVEIGMMLQVAPRGELFLAGLLQDIGMLALNEALPGYGRLSASSLNDHFLLAEIERRELKTDHAVVGAWLLHRWGLPERLVSAVINSHLHEKNKNLLASSVALGSCIADMWINTESVATLANAINVADTLFSMEREQVDHMLARTAEVFPEMVADLDMDIGDEFEINKLLDQSRSTLAEINVRMIHETRGLAAQAQRDSLTMLYNRTYLEQHFGNQFELSVNTGQPLTVIFIDVDYFKEINDTYGHASGDIVLIAVARTIRAAIRNYDIAVRYGGDEFVAVLSNTPQDVALSVSERIRSMVAEQTYILEGGVEIRATVSIGYATLTPESGIKTAMELLEAADKKLYSAKYAGRNRVV